MLESMAKQMKIAKKGDNIVVDIRQEPIIPLWVQFYMAIMDNKWRSKSMVDKLKKNFVTW